MSNSRVNEIDLLRFFAALAVVMYHYAFRGHAADKLSVMPYPLLAPVAKYGFLGVELFFMISGFVILMTAANGSLKGFVISRIVRLYPAFWACCTLTFVLTLAIGAPHFFTNWREYLVNMTLLGGFVGVPPMDGVYWSLFVEMRFYVLVALLLIIRRIHQAQLFLSLWLALAIVYEIFNIHHLNDVFIVEYAAYFIAGSVFYLIWSQGLTLSRILLIAVSWVLALKISVEALADTNKHFNTIMNEWIVGSIISLFFVVMLLVALRKTGSFGRRQWLAAGALTYPFYLLHQKIGFMVFNLAYPAVNPHLLFWGMLLAALLTSYAVNVLIEKKLARPMKKLLTGTFDSIEQKLLSLLPVKKAEEPQ
jgi:peptidoglycan/LPS O-acetylase OafA/YrhL